MKVKKRVKSEKMTLIYKEKEETKGRYIEHSKKARPPHLWEAVVLTNRRLTLCLPVLYMSTFNHSD